MEDPVTVIIWLLQNNLSVTKDDGTTKANVLVSSKWYDDTTMNSVDAMVTVGQLTDTIMPTGLGHPQDDHTDVYEVNVWTVSKFDASGNQIITDEILRWKILQQISSITRTNEYYPQYGSPLQPSNIANMRIRVSRNLDDPSKTPYPLRRTQLEVELRYQRTNLAS